MPECRYRWARTASTVEYHPHKVFRKFGATIRVQLARALSEQHGAPASEDRSLSAPSEPAA